MDSYTVTGLFSGNELFFSVKVKVPRQQCTGILIAVLKRSMVQQLLESHFCNEFSRACVLATDHTVVCEDKRGSKYSANSTGCGAESD